MPIIKTEDWNKWVENNQDPYGDACIKVAEKVMEMLDAQAEFTPHDIICKANKKSGAGGISGFMAGCVAEMVSHCHSRGEEFRKAWNGDVGKATGQENASGVLNPAILTISI